MKLQRTVIQSLDILRRQYIQVNEAGGVDTEGGALSHFQQSLVIVLQLSLQATQASRARFLASVLFLDLDKYIVPDTGGLYDILHQVRIHFREVAEIPVVFVLVDIGHIGSYRQSQEQVAVSVGDGVASQDRQCAVSLGFLGVFRFIEKQVYHRLTGQQ